MPKACKMFFNYQTIGPKGRRSGWSGYKLYSKDNGVVLSRCKVLPRVRQRQFINNNFPRLFTGPSVVTGKTASTRRENRDSNRGPKGSRTKDTLSSPFLKNNNKHSTTTKFAKEEVGELLEKCHRQLMKCRQPAVARQ